MNSGYRFVERLKPYRSINICFAFYNYDFRYFMIECNITVVKISLKKIMLYIIYP